MKAVLYIGGGAIAGAIIGGAVTMALWAISPFFAWMFIGLVVYKIFSY